MAFYPRSIEIEGTLYKQISPNQWQNVNTGQIIDNTRMVIIINEYKKKAAAPVTPTGGPTGACCTIPNQTNGQFVCQNIREEGCGGGCFTVGENCNRTDEQGPLCEENCVRCCFIGNNYCVALKPFNCVAAGGTHFGTNGCTACKFGVCSSDQNNDTTNAAERFYGSRGCTGTFIVGGGVSDFRTGVFCTGSGVGQTCFGPGMQYQALTSHFIQGGTCADCIIGSCCTGGTCVGITSQSACSLIGGLFFAGQTCGQCDFGVYCSGVGNDRTCIRTGYRGETLSDQFQVGATCSYCTMGTCCKSNGDRQVGVRKSDCTGTFFEGIFNQNACDKGSCCVGPSCTENNFRYDCFGVFNNGMTCIACGNGSCCLPGGGCTLTSGGNCSVLGGIFFGGATCSACDNGVCCNNGSCSAQKRGNICSGTFYTGVDSCVDAPCDIGSCCTGGTCLGSVPKIVCDIAGGEFFVGQTCGVCVTGANCLQDENNNDICESNVIYGDRIGELFFPNQGCSACDTGACCNLLGGGITGVRGNCIGSSTFYAGQTLFICDAGVFCTGSNEGQTCFGLGHRGQSLTNNFIVGATCNACILGACCTGGTCLGNGLTSQAACSSAGGLFFAGRTCTVCDYGVYCTGATCLSFGYRGQSLTNNFILGATCSSCILGACCTGGTCSEGGQTSQAACNGLFYPGATCRACDYGVYCTGATCFESGYRAQTLTNNFIQGATCSSCILGACCTGGTCLGEGQTSQAACLIAGGTFYAGATCFQCDMGVYCTGSGIGQTCFGLGHRGQSLTNNFIAGATCDSCILGACCTGGTCYGGTLTSKATCNSINGLFFEGATCDSCVYGVYCTGSQENTSCIGLGYKAQNLSNQFVISGICKEDCVYGACCSQDGTTCYGITSSRNCNLLDGIFKQGFTCDSCFDSLGACCTGGNSSLKTIAQCNAIGGVFFVGGTALCATGSCCTGGTCGEEYAGRSGSCELFIQGATCGVCDIGVYCTGATCLQLGFRGQSLATVFIVGETCSSCIQGICCKDNYEYSQIAGGKEHSVALTTYGEVRGFGGNTYNQSGMTLALGYTGIAAGFYHTLAISNGGTVSAWGRNQYGQSTVPTGLTGVVQVAAGEYHSIALRSNGGVTCWGWNGQQQCNVPAGLTGVTMIVAGGGHNLALKQDGTVAAWGYNYDGQTNVPAGLTGVIQVAAGYHHSLALLNGGGITCWGMTLYGQCNIPTGLTASKIAAGGYHTLILKANGEVTAFGRTGYGQIVVPAGLNAKQIAGGEFHSLAINASNAVVTWGSNIYGETDLDPTTCESLNEKQCGSKFGIFNAGAEQCSVCENKVNCCVNGEHSYVLAETCASLGGIAFTGADDPTTCLSGVFCNGITCAGLGLFGENLSGDFKANKDCGDCIQGNCCTDGVYQYTTQNECIGDFYPGVQNNNACTEGLIGICCEGGTCNAGIAENNCQGYFISNEIAQANFISCSTNPCEIGVCCKETEITSVTGGTCAGIMTRAECTFTGGDFFPSSEGYTCSNCLYTPMLASILVESFAATSSAGETKQLFGAQSGYTGNQIQPRKETNVKNNTWVSTSNGIYVYGPSGVTKINSTLCGGNSVGGSKRIIHSYSNFGGGFSAWYNSGITLRGTLGNTAQKLYDISGISFDYSPAFSKGVTSAYGFSLGHILPSGSTNTDKFEVPRYYKFVLGYGNPEDLWHGKELVFRYGIQTTTTSNISKDFYLNDATKHAELPESATRNNFHTVNDESPWQTSTTDPTFSSPILIQVFAENPLKFRTRPSGSCCVGATCIGIVTQDHCTLAGGTFNLNGGCESCFPNLIIGNCCTGGTFYGFTNEAACNSVGGYFKKSRTLNPNICLYGTECLDKNCIAPNIYIDQYTGGTGRTFVKFNYEENLGCSACDRGICCVGTVCNGYMPRLTCAGLSGTFYENESVCGEVCNVGVCCELNGSGCGTYTNSVNCRGINQYFASGASPGETCSACNSLFQLAVNASGVSYEYTFNKGTTYGTFSDGSLWVQETDDLRLLDVRVKYDDAQLTFYKKLAAGKDHTIALTNHTGFVLGYGSNQYGQIGFTLENSFRKTYNTFGEGFKDIAAGFYHTLAVSNGGTVSAWGRNDKGQCNVPSGLTNIMLVSAGEAHSVALNSDGGVTCWGDNSYNQLNMPVDLSGVTFIACGARHTLALKSDGTVVAWGDNSQRQCNVPAGLSNVTKISAGYYHNLAIFGPNTGVTGWGRTLEGQLNIIGISPPFTIIAAGGYHSLINGNSKAKGYGLNSSGQATTKWETNAYTKLYAGENNSLALSEGNRAFSWGSTANGKNNLKNLSEYKANTKISNIDLTPGGYKGTIYIHGADKNPLPRSYIDLVGGYTFIKQKFVSINYDDYNKGWLGPYTPSATEDDNNYVSFSPSGFEKNIQQFKYGGMTLAGGDVVVCNATNFSIYYKAFPDNAGAYPYQLTPERANTLTYGIVNCLSATGASLAGSTSCFRPPVTWPIEDRQNKPIYKVSSMEGRIPGQPGNTLIVAPRFENTYKGLYDPNIYVTYKNQMKSYAQASEFGDGIDYGVLTPMWGLAGYGSSINSYGGQYVDTVCGMLQYVYATGSTGTNLTTNERLEFLTRVVQYGIDSWGAQKIYCMNLQSGAGQKPARTRPWISVAGYFIGEPSMYDPEATMYNDVTRREKFIEHLFTSEPAQLPGRTSPPGSWHTVAENGVCATTTDWLKYRIGGTGEEGIKRLIARSMHHDVNTLVEFINDRSNLLRHYEYAGVYYKNTKFSGFTVSGPTGITFYNEFNRRLLDLEVNNKNIISGNFGVMRYGSAATAINPFFGYTLNSKGVTVGVYRFTEGTKEGTAQVFQNGWLRVESGPGSSGPNGATASRYYRTLFSNGFRSDSDPVTTKYSGYTAVYEGTVGGWQIVIGQTWADGIPDHTSVLRFYPFTEIDMGITRPCTSCALGYTYSKLGFIQRPSPGECSAWDANPGIFYDATMGRSPYQGTSLDVWMPPWFFLDYITRTKGITLVNNISANADMLKQYLFTSPYNIGGLFFYAQSNSEVLDEWVGINMRDMQKIKSMINFAEHFPGIVNWSGITV